jgi:hypothetical protein
MLAKREGGEQSQGEQFVEMTLPFPIRPWRGRKVKQGNALIARTSVISSEEDENGRLTRQNLWGEVGPVGT